VSLLAAPIWGAVADGVGDARGPILVAGLLAALAAASLGLAAVPLALAVAMASVAATTAGITPMVDSRVVRVIGHRDRFGQARAAGSAAFIVLAFVTGAVVSRLGPDGLFLLSVPLLAATGIGAWVLLRLPERGPDGSAIGADRPAAARSAVAALSPGRIVEVLRLPRVALFVPSSIVIWMANAAFLNFISLRVAALGGDGTMIAAVFSVGALVEVPLMLAFPRISRRIGPERLVVIGAFAFALRSLGSALATSPEQIIVAAMFGGFGFAFVYVGTVTWVSGAVPRSLQATAQGLATGATISIGAIGGSFLGGAIGAAQGLPALFGLAAAGSAVGGVLVWMAIARRAENLGAERSEPTRSSPSSS
jgi:MFS transporter, PPP family, 3-phenylpropionic acid transporter